MCHYNHLEKFRKICSTSHYSSIILDLGVKKIIEDCGFKFMSTIINRSHGLPITEWKEIPSIERQTRSYATVII